MKELIDLGFEFLGASDYAQYGTILITVCYILSHIVQYLPIKYSEKIPNCVMIALNIIAAKHGAEKSAATDLAGNVVSKVLEEEDE